MRCSRKRKGKRKEGAAAGIGPGTGFARVLGDVRQNARRVHWRCFHRKSGATPWSVTH